MIYLVAFVVIGSAFGAAFVIDYLRGNWENWMTPPDAPGSTAIKTPPARETTLAAEVAAGLHDQPHP